MARYPGARWRPVTGHTDGPMRSHLGVVLHVNESTGNLYNWVAGDHDMSCHFEVYKNGDVEQYIDTRDSAWAQKDGNATYLSIETEGYATEALTDAQCEAIAGILSWCRDTHGIPLRTCEVPGQRGFGWHGMGAAHGYDWGHAECPGTIRRDQRQHILDIASGDDDMSATQYDALMAAIKATNQNVTMQAGQVPHDVWAYKFKGQQALGYLVAGADPSAFAAAVVAALPASDKGGLTEADVEAAVKKVFADAAS